MDAYLFAAGPLMPYYINSKMHFFKDAYFISHFNLPETRSVTLASSFVK